jgi:hypothetical protein
MHSIMVKTWVYWGRNSSRAYIRRHAHLPFPIFDELVSRDVTECLRALIFNALNLTHTCCGNEDKDGETYQHLDNN